MTKIGEFLVQRGLLNREQLERALKESRISGELIGKTLLRMKLVTQEKLLMALGEQLGIPYYPSLQQLDIPQEVIKAVSPKFIQHYKFMPVKLKGNVLTVAVSDPLAVWLLEDLKLHLGFDIERVLATQEEILAGIKRYYGVGADTVEEILTQEKTGKGKQSRYETLEEIQDIGDMGKTAEDASVIKLVNQILSESVNARATDIHLETFRDYVRVRYRIDGILYICACRRRSNICIPPSSRA
jgi:type IV pilus assembly protein PilB